MSGEGQRVGKNTRQEGQMTDQNKLVDDGMKEEK